MTALAERPAAFALRRAWKAHLRDRVTLQATGDGWSLIGPRGELVFRGLGMRSRRQCLEFARDHGIGVVLS